jgi:CheY-like chemotaxis protein
VNPSTTQTLELTAALKPDVLLLDLMMPDEGIFTHEATLVPRKIPPNSCSLIGAVV